MKKDHILMVTVIVSLILLLCIPLSIAENFAIQTVAVDIRGNIVLTGFILSLVLMALPMNINKIDGAYFVLVLFYFLISLIRLLIVEEYQIDSTINPMLDLTIPFLLYLYIKSIKDDHVFELIQYAVIGIGFFVALQVLLFNLIVPLVGWSDWRDTRPITTIGESTISAYALVVFFMVTLINYLRNKRKILILFLALFSFAILLEETRGALLTYLVFIMFIMIAADLSHRIKLLVGFIILFLSILVIDPQIYHELFLRIFTDNSIGSNDLRLELFKEGLSRFSEYPLFGTGIGFSLDRTISKLVYSTYIGNPHNQFLSIMVETGIVGFLLLFSWFITILISSLRKITGVNKYYCYAYISFICSAFWFENFLTSDIRGAIGFWIIISFMRRSELVKNKFK